MPVRQSMHSWGLTFVFALIVTMLTVLWWASQRGDSPHLLMLPQASDSTAVPGSPAPSGARGEPARSIVLESDASPAGRPGAVSSDRSVGPRMPESPGGEERVEEPVTPRTPEQRRAFVDIVLKQRLDECPPHLLSRETVERCRSRLSSDLTPGRRSEAEALLGELYRADLTCRLLKAEALEHYVMTAPDLLSPTRGPSAKEGEAWRLTRGLLEPEKALFGDSGVLEVRAWLDYSTYAELGAASRKRHDALARLQPFER